MISSSPNYEIGPTKWLGAIQIIRDTLEVCVYRTCQQMSQGEGSV